MSNILTFEHVLQAIAVGRKMEGTEGCGKKVRLTKTEKNSSYINKLKDNRKFDEYKKRRAAASRAYRLKKKNEECKLSQEELNALVEERRAIIRERVRKHREGVKAKKMNERMVSLDIIEGYRPRQSLGKAVKKVEKALPYCPRKKKEVLAVIVSSIDKSGEIYLGNALNEKPSKKPTNVDALNLDIKSFFERDDISQVSPKARDVKSFIVDGKEVRIPLRYMVLSLKEAHALFVEERNGVEKVMEEPIQMEIKVEEEEIVCQDYQQNINSSNIQREKTLDANKQCTKDGAKDFESMSALSTNDCDRDNDDYDDEDEEHECTLCARLFQSQKLFKAHIKEHAKLDGLLSDSGGEDDFQTMRDSETKNAYHQSIPSKKSAHMHTNAEEIPYICLHCPKTFAKKRQFQKHMNRHQIGRQHKCEICSKSFPYPSHLEYHMRIHTGERPHECDVCSKKFKKMGQLTVHKRAHKGERPFTCDTCSKSFQTSFNLKTHMRSHTGEKPFKCEVCKKNFTNQSYLKIHLRNHIGDRPYKCSHCSKTYLTSSHLSAHARTHTGERLFKCELCIKSFAKNHSLKIHMRSHTDERPFKCSECPATFTINSNLIFHKRTHAERPFQCDQCTENCSTKEEFENHALKHQSKP